MSLGNSAGISFSGLSSGLDTDSIIRQLGALERRPIQRLQRQQAMLQAQKAAYEQFRNQVTGLTTALSAFNLPNAFEAVKASSSVSDNVTISAAAGASTGIREITVQRLATAERLSSIAQQSPTQPLGVAGSFRVNDVTITATETDTLQTLAEKINSARPGATASVVNGGNGRAYLTLTSNETGAANRLRIEDVGVNGPVSAREGVMARLGLVNLAAQTRSSQTAQITLNGPANATLSQALGVDPGVRELELNGQKINVDFGVETIQSLTQRLNRLPGVEARLTTSGDVPPVQTIDVIGDGPITLTGPSELSIDISDREFSFGAVNVTQLVAGQDAEYRLDGIAFTSSSNTLTNVIQGATVTLVKAEPDRRVNLAVTRDTDGVVQTIRGMMTAYNRINGFIRETSQFDAKTFDSGPLFGDSIASQVQAVLGSTVFGSTQGLNSNLRNLTQIGFALDASGNLTLDESSLRNAIDTNPTAVGNLLRSTGLGSNNNINFIAGGVKTKETVGDGYAINITRAATQTRIVANAAQTGATAGPEVLTFSGSGLGSTPIQLNLGAGLSQADIAAKINNDSRLNRAITATVEEGKLVLTSKTYGAASNFNVFSNLGAGATNSGIGSAGQALKTTGVDVEGTINGEPATGSGRFLLGQTGNANTEGLQIEYTGTATGNVGTLRFSKGVGSKMFDALESFTNFQNGLFTTSTASIDSQIADIESRIGRITTRASEREVELRNRFAAMEAAISRAQAQLARVQQISAGR